VSDETLRTLERAAAASPGDGTALEALDRAQARAGRPTVRQGLAARLAAAIEKRRADLEMFLRLRRALMFTAIYGRVYGPGRGLDRVTEPPEIVRRRTASLTGRMTGRLVSRESNLAPLSESDLRAPPPPTLEEAEAMTERWARQYRQVAQFRDRVARDLVSIDFAELERRTLRHLEASPQAVFGMTTPDGDSVRRLLDPEMSPPPPRYGSWMEEVEDAERRAGRVFPDELLNRATLCPGCNTALGPDGSCVNGPDCRREGVLRGRGS
jgi:hypothetical protein